MKLAKRLTFSALFPFSLSDLCTTCVILFCASGCCIILQNISTSPGFASPVYVLAVLLISRLTTGYLFGFLSSIFSVIFVNYIFTFPYLAFDFTLSGYPLTTLTFLVVSIVTCTLTTQARQQEQLRIENEKIKMRANLLRSVSHDIRTPLTSIIGSTSAVLDNPNLSPEAQRALLKDVRDEAQWLIQVVENLLSITRISNGPAKITMQPEAAEEILSESVRKSRRRFPGVNISVAVPDELLMVPMDPILIQQVISNLIENAVIHGKTTTEIRLLVEPQGSFARFFVRDNGNGIPDKILPYLFDGSLKYTEVPLGDGKRNMGLGLSVCRAIILAHGGTIEAKNSTTGAEFSFCLPLCKEELS